jgi:hypothetical protein
MQQCLLSIDTPPEARTYGLSETRSPILDGRPRTRNHDREHVVYIYILVPLVISYPGIPISQTQRPCLHGRLQLATEAGQYTIM